MAQTFVCWACSARFPASTQQVGITVSCPECGSQCETPTATEDEDFGTVHLIPTLEEIVKRRDPLVFGHATLGEWWAGLHDREWALDQLGTDLRGLTLDERAALAAKLLDPDGISTFAEMEA